MIKFVVLFVLCSAALAVEAQKCSVGDYEKHAVFTDMVTPCIYAVRKQIQMEVGASYTYMAMAAHFAREDINRPGFAKLFFESATEERSHAAALIEYLLMRGPTMNGLNVTSLISGPTKENIVEVVNGVDALERALKTEVKVTKSIRNLIQTCESCELSCKGTKEPPCDNAEYVKWVDDECEKDKAKGFNDYHLVDYLTGEFLEEQYQGQRELAGKISTLGKMMANSGAIGEFLFDKTLL